MRYTNEVIKKIDFERLRTQREWLIGLAMSETLDEKSQEAADGLVNLLDALVDALVEDVVLGADGALLYENEEDLRIPTGWEGTD